VAGMIFSRTNTFLGFIVAALLILISSCSSPSEKISQNILTTAWLACKSATGSPTQNPFVGKAVLAWNLHPKMDYQTENSLIRTEQVDSLWITNARYFILGNYSETRYYPEYNPQDYFTLDLNEAGALLCLSVKYTDIETCTYGSGFYVVRATAEVSAKLVSWPDEKIIAETNIATGSPKSCAPMLNTSQLGDHLVEVNNIDIWKWFLKYKQESP